MRRPSRRRRSRCNRCRCSRSHRTRSPLRRRRSSRSRRSTRRRSRSAGLRHARAVLARRPRCRAVLARTRRRRRTPCSARRARIRRPGNIRGSSPGPHVASQVPFTHSSSAAQVWQALPFSPQAPPSAPPRHVAPQSSTRSNSRGRTRRPVAHAPRRALRPGAARASCRRCRGRRTRSRSCPGGRGCPGSSRWGHEVPSHAPSVWHALATQAAVSPQSWQAPPPEPHASSAPPPTQVSPSQHPAHVSGCTPWRSHAAPPPCRPRRAAHGSSRPPPAPPHADVPLTPFGRARSRRNTPGSSGRCTRSPRRRRRCSAPPGAHCEPVHASQA